MSESQGGNGQEVKSKENETTNGRGVESRGFEEVGGFG